MSVTTLNLESELSDATINRASRPKLHSRTQLLLQGPVASTLLTLALPNLLIMVAQASTGLIETYFIAKLGTDALAGMALVFPPVMLMQMVSGGAMGGGISSAIARALGGGRTEDANALALHAVIINAGLGMFFSIIMLAFGEPIYRFLGGNGGELQAALIYSNIVFAGNVLLWTMNGLASVVRGTGNMLMPALVIFGGVLLLVPLSPLLIFGIGPFPALGIAGGAVAFVLFNAAGAAVLGWYVISGRNPARLRLSKPRWAMFRDILGVGAVAAVTSIQTNVVIALATAMVAVAAGADAVAGYGTGARLEYLLVPLVFGLGAPLVALVGTNVGAGQHERAIRIALIGGSIAFAITEAIGVAAALWPQAWLRLYSTDAQVIATGSTYLRVVGPFYGFFGLGLALYFSSQGAGKLLWPLVAGSVRMAVALIGGWLVLRWTGSLQLMFATLAAGLVLYGMIVLIAVVSGGSFRASRGVKDLTQQAPPTKATLRRP